MILKKQQASEEGVIVLSDCVACIWRGILNGVPTMIYLAADEGEQGREIVTYIKTIGDKVTAAEMNSYEIAVIINNEAECMFFTEKPKIITSPMQLPKNIPPGMREM